MRRGSSSYFRDGANITPLVKTQYVDILTLLAPEKRCP